MFKNDKDELEQSLHFQEGSAYYAKKLNIPERDVARILKLLRKKQRKATRLQKVKGEGISPYNLRENLEKGTAEMSFHSMTEIKTLDELISLCKIDTRVWEITRYVQNYWGNRHDPRWQVKAYMKKKPVENIFIDSFTGFLATYKPTAERIEPPVIEENKPGACLLIDKQDAHLNRFDIHGSNDIHERLEKIEAKVALVVNQATLSHNLERLIYVIGSDAFNSEFTNMTTRGTPQENILSYDQAYTLVCDHEVKTIRMFLENSMQVDVMFIPGNHDRYAGWHMVNWLKMYFRDEPRVAVDETPDFRKYASYGKSAMMFNHGDKTNHQKLAGIFPQEFRKGWSDHEIFYAFTGDKHVERSEIINGIKFYRVAAFTTTRSEWEHHNGYIDSLGEASGFLIDKNTGITNIFKHYI